MKLDSQERTQLYKNLRRDIYAEMNERRRAGKAALEANYISVPTARCTMNLRTSR